jgi:hypothetical protein
VSLFRFRVADMMTLIAIAAFDIGAVRMLFDQRTDHLLNGRLVFGALPMASVLAVSFLTARQHPANRPFLLGFEAFGIMALSLYVALATFFRGETVLSYLWIFRALFENAIGTSQPFVLIWVWLSIVAVVLGLPQLAFALLGGILSRRYRVTITRR